MPKRSYSYATGNAKKKTSTRKAPAKKTAKLPPVNFGGSPAKRPRPPKKGTKFVTLPAKVNKNSLRRKS